MKRFRYVTLSYKVQIFLASLLLVFLPVTVTFFFNSSRNARKLIADYNNSQQTLLTQSSLTLDTLLKDSVKVTYLPIVSKDFRKIMKTDYQTDYLSYAMASSKFKEEFIKANLLNENLTACMFQNRYGYTFEYNLTGAVHTHEIKERLSAWADAARISPEHTYFPPLQSVSAASQDMVLPVVRILYDSSTFEEIGVCYLEINFQSVEKIIRSAASAKSTFFIYDSEGALNYTAGQTFSTLEQTDIPSGLLDALSSFNGAIPSDSAVFSKTITVEGKKYLLNGCMNRTTGWHIIELIDNSVLQNIYYGSYINYCGVLLFSLLLGLVLAALMSARLSSSISRLCREIDSSDPNHYSPISMDACGSNVELRKLVNSFNRQNQRLSASLQQNYDIRLHEQQTRIQMLQFQINHHFLYNTLNVISSLAIIHNIPEISSVALSMSELLRYNLTKFPKAFLWEEIEQVHRYMTIENIRFPGKFNFECSIPASFDQLEVPSFILQPLVENSIEHGFSERETDCNIYISSTIEDGDLHILVADNGSGMTDESLALLKASLDGPESDSAPASSDNSTASSHRHRSIGLRNVHQRIRNSFGDAYGISIESRYESGTLVDIKLPVNKK